MRLSPKAQEFVLAQERSNQDRLLQALREIRANPGIGSRLPFPWLPNILGSGVGDYLIVYELTDDGVIAVNAIKQIPEIIGVL